MEDQARVDKNWMAQPDPPADGKRIWLVRHAQARPVCENHSTDPGLTVLGRRQAEALKRHYSSAAIDVIFTSTMRRAQETAEIVGENHGGAELLVEAGLNEIHAVGKWRDCSAEEVRRLNQIPLYRMDDQPPGGESLRMFNQRVNQCWQTLLRSAARNILVISHGGVLGMLVSLAFGMGETQESNTVLAYPHTASSELWVTDGSRDPRLPPQVITVRYVCRSGHLPPSMRTL